MNVASLALLSLAVMPADPQGGIGRIPNIGSRPKVLTQDPDRPAAPKMREIKVELNALSYRKSEDGDRGDEPYLLGVGFTFGISKDVRGFFVSSNGIEVELISRFHQNNLGYPDQWAQSNRRYPISGQVFSRRVPVDSGITVVGVTWMMMEEDGFNANQCLRLREDFKWRVKSCIETVARETGGQGQVYFEELARKIAIGLSSPNSAPFYPSLYPLGSGDLDDMAGSRSIMVVNTGMAPGTRIPPKGVRFFLSLDRPSDLPRMTEVTNQGGLHNARFSMLFPAGDLSRVPAKAKYKGEALFGGNVFRSD